MNRRTAFLQEMGVGPVWTLRDRGPQTAALPVEREEVMPETLPDTLPVFDAMPCFDDVPLLDELPPHFDDSEFVHELAAQAPVAARPDVSGMGWEALEDTIRNCTACGLCQGRTQAVPGVGDREADWLFIGEGPGFYEDKQGEPFVGNSGKLLDNMLAAIGLKRGANAYIANVVKCRPTDTGGKDRAPTPAEASACRAYLDRQIALIQPKIIVTLGRVASTALLEVDAQTPMAVLRGKRQVHRTPDGRQIPLIATYHPAYLLRQLTEKRKAWEDLCLALDTFPAD